MDKMSVVGGSTLNGRVAISGAKNSALPLIFSTILAEGSHKLSNVPHLKDIESSKLLMESLGCSVEFSKNVFSVSVPKKMETLAHYDQVRKMRASILVLGPLLARFGEARVSLPGGCAIGARPIGMHLDALEQLGAQIEVVGGYVEAKCKRLKGCTIDLPFATVGGTENIMMAACLADGTTIINNAAREPEIEDLANYLNSMGAEVSGAGTPVVTIVGKESLVAASHSVIPDRIEAGTLMVAGALSGGEVHLDKCEPKHLESFINALNQMGVCVAVQGKTISVKGCSKLKPIEVTTEPYPGFPTDLQAQLMVLMTQADGTSHLVEKVFENRFMHVSELNRLGARIETDGKRSSIDGASKNLVGAPVMATDLRASACLILAGLVADGETIVNRIYHLDRGYEKLENKLSILGAKIKRVKE